MLNKLFLNLIPLALMPWQEINLAYLFTPFFAITFEKKRDTFVKTQSKKGILL